MNIERYIPNSVLKPFIKAYIIIESENGTENCIVPDTSLVMAIRFKGAVSLQENGVESSLPGVALSGIRQTTRLIRYFPQSANFLITFEPGGAAAFFEEPLHEFFGQSLPVDSLRYNKHIQEIAERISEATDNKERVFIAEQFLGSKLGRQDVDPLMIHAVQRIKANQGNTRIKELTKTLNISEDAFEKRFRRIIGTSAKQFSNIVRLRNVISKGRANRTLTDIAYDSGYFDQSHFTKDFKLFTGQTPLHFFKTPPRW